MRVEAVDINPTHSVGVRPESGGMDNPGRAKRRATGHCHVERRPGEPGRSRDISLLLHRAPYARKYFSTPLRSGRNERGADAWASARNDKHAEPLTRWHNVPAAPFADRAEFSLAREGMAP